MQEQRKRSPNSDQYWHCESCDMERVFNVLRPRADLQIESEKRRWSALGISNIEFEAFVRHHECANCGHQMTTIQIPAERLENFVRWAARLGRFQEAVLTAAVQHSSYELRQLLPKQEVD